MYKYSTIISRSLCQRPRRRTIKPIQTQKQGHTLKVLYRTYTISIFKEYSTNILPTYGEGNMSNTSTARKKGASPSSRYLRAHGVFSVIVAIVALYGGVGMVLGGRTLGLPLFDVLGFGPNTRGLDRDAVQYCIFAFGVLGSVIVGWMVLMWFVVRNLAVHPDATVRAHARHAIMWSTAVWFVFDTGFSLATGELAHAAFNIPFVCGLAGPMYLMETSDATSDANKMT
jgi:hypothetical protein